MNWYCITPCPKYAISEDGQYVINLERMTVLHHKTAPYAKDGLTRYTLYYRGTHFGVTRAYRQVYTTKYLSENFIKEENLVNVDESKIIW